MSWRSYEDYWYWPILCNISSLEHKCLNNIKKIYQHASKCDNQQNLKDILDAAMVSATEELTEKSTPIFNKTVLSSSADHASSASNLAGISISSQLDNKDITIN